MIVSSLIGRLKYLKGETGKLYESGGNYPGRIERYINREKITCLFRLRAWIVMLSYPAFDRPLAVASVMRLAPISYS
jgi:hypothetical protein